MTDESVTYDPFDNAPCPVAYDTQRGLRERCPVTQLPTGFFLATRHDDVHAVLRDGGVFWSNGPRSLPVTITGP